jgi:Ig domain of plant-specific actin-binding protein
MTRSAGTITQPLALLAAASLWALPGLGKAQDLVGCQLVGATLQCVPGVSESPQQQIRQLQQQISTDIQLEGAVQQRINGLQQLVLAGHAAVGALLTATAVADAQAALQGASYHWYRLNPNQQRSWVLIEGARGSTYVPAPVDIGHNLMVVVVVNQSGVVKRVASQPIGPVQP